MDEFGTNFVVFFDKLNLKLLYVASVLSCFIKMPIKYINKMIRVMYWWQIVNLDKSEVVCKSYKAQKVNKTKYGCVELHEKNKVDLELGYQDEELCKKKHSDKL